MQTKLIQENISISYKIDYLQIHSDIFVYEINIEYPQNSHLIAPKLKLNEFHSGVANWEQIESYIKTKNFSSLPQRIYTFLKWDEGDSLGEEKAQKELISDCFKEKFPNETVFVIDDDDYELSHYEDEPVKIKIKDFLNESGELCQAKLQRLRLANPLEPPFIYNSRLELMAGAVRFKNADSLNSDNFDLKSLLEHFKSIEQVQINKEIHTNDSAMIYMGEGKTDTVDITYHMTMEETKLFHRVYKYLNSLPLKARQKHNLYEDSTSVFLFLDFLKIIEHRELVNSTKDKDKDNWRLNYYLNQYKEVLPIKERLALELNLEFDIQNRASKKIKV